MSNLVIALAGRRVDAPDSADPRFPPQNIDKVRERISEFFTARHASLLVSAAACGADLLALEAAGKLNMRRRVVLPCTRDVFRRTSVADRPGDWGEQYDKIIADVDRLGDLIELQHCAEELRAYSATNRAVLEEAVRLARANHEAVSAVLVWDGKPKMTRDYTQLFGLDARALGLPVEEISTL